MNTETCNYLARGKYFPLHLFLVLLVFYNTSMAQGPTCNTAEVLCEPNLAFPAETSAASLGGVPSCIADQASNFCVDCTLSTTPNPAFYTITVKEDGDLYMQLSSAPAEDVDFAIWGPYLEIDPVVNCAGTTFPPGSPLDCDYSNSTVEEIDIPGVKKGETYILLITNFSGNPTDISLIPNTSNGTNTSFLGGPLAFDGSQDQVFADTDLAANLETIPAVGDPNISSINFAGTGITDAGLGTFDPATAGLGSHEIVVTATSWGCVTSDTISIVVSTVPTIVPETSSINEDDPATTINVVANDFDTDGGIDTSSLRIISPPPNGTAVVNTLTGELSYTPAENFFGTDSVEYEVCDDVGLCGSARLTFSIGPVPDAPEANPETGYIYEDIPLLTNVLINDFDVDGDLDTSSLSIVTGPANGTATLDPTNGDVLYIPNPDFNGLDSMTYEICDLTATPFCDQARLLFIVLDVNDGPWAEDDFASGSEDGLLNIDVLSNDGDPDGTLDPLTVSVDIAPANGTATANPDGTIDYMPNADFFGTDAMRYTVCDDDGACVGADIMITITAVNDAPIVVNDYAITTGTTPVNVVVTANDDDIDGSLAMTTLAISAAPADGSATASPFGGQISYTADPGFSGTDMLTYTICDDGVPSLCNTAILAVIVNPATATLPAVTDDLATTAEDVALSLNPLDNDAPGDSPLDSTTVSILAGPANGSGLVDPVNGEITYTPNADFTGLEEMTYRICDTDGDCEIGTISITVTPVADPPIAVDDALTVDEDATVSFDLTANDTDADGDLDVTSVTIDASPSNGLALLDAATGVITYTPAADYFGADAMAYIICDGTGLCDTAAVNITVLSVNDAPVAINDTSNTTVNTPKTGDPLINDFDTDGAIDATSVTVVSGPASGGATVDAISGAITYTPNPGFVGSDWLTYNVCDNGSPVYCDEAFVFFQVGVINPPDIVNDLAVTDEDTEVIIDVVGNDIPGDHPLDWSTLFVGSAPLNGTTSVDAATGEITYDPLTDFNGMDSFEYILCDTSDFCNIGTVLVTVNPIADAPVAVDDVATTTEEVDVTTSILTNDVDPDWDLDYTSFSTIAGPFNGTQTYDAVTGELRYSPDVDFHGMDSLEYQVCDMTGPVPLCDQAYLVITVNPVDDAPAISTVPAGTADYCFGDEIVAPAISLTEIDGDSVIGYVWISSGYEVTEDSLSENTLLPSIWNAAAGRLSIGPAPAIQIEAALQTVAYFNKLAPGGETSGVRDISFAVVDENGLAFPYGTDTLTTAVDPVSADVSSCDADADGIADGEECSGAWNCDPDLDGFPNYLDIDSDDDGIPDAYECSDGMPCADTDLDGIPDFLDLDSDDDGIADEAEAGDDPLNPVDTDGDGVEDFRDTDSDNDGLADYTEADQPAPTGSDADGDGIDDAYDIDATGSGLTYNPVDTDADGLEDYRDTDSDNDGILDVIEAGLDFENPVDTDGDGVEDFRDDDSDGDGIADIDEGTDDCNNNGSPNYLDIEACDLRAVEVFTPNGDGVNDEFYVWGILSYPNSELLVYNRWENVVYRKRGYRNNWRGEFQQSGGDLPDGTYFYVLTLDRDDPTSPVLVGDVTIHR